MDLYQTEPEMRRYRRWSASSYWRRRRQSWQAQTREEAEFGGKQKRAQTRRATAGGTASGFSSLLQRRTEVGGARSLRARVPGSSPGRGGGGGEHVGAKHREARGRELAREFVAAIADSSFYNLFSQISR